MPFKDTQEGSTHYHNDGCGDTAHNGMTLQEKLREGWGEGSKKNSNLGNYNEHINLDISPRTISLSSVKELEEKLKNSTFRKKAGSELTEKYLARKHGYNQALVTVLALIREMMEGK